jgi:hypothetical protein
MCLRRAGQFRRQAVQVIYVKENFMNAEKWVFDQGPNVAAITTRQVIEDGLPILNVVHYDDDDSWAFTCGTTNDSDDGRVIAMREALNLDSTLTSIADLPPGWYAWRESVGGTWHKEKSA